jgi:hypothetical protein
MKFLNFLPPPYNFIASGAIVGLLGLIIVLSFRSCDHRHDSEQANLVNQGILVERSDSQAETINAVKDAQQTLEHPTNEQLNLVCSRYDRNCPTNHP